MCTICIVHWLTKIPSSMYFLLSFCACVLATYIANHVHTQVASFAYGKTAG